MPRPCLTCGTQQAAIMRCRVISETKAQLRKSVLPSPFVWQYVWRMLDAAESDEGVYMCASCGQWLRRVAEGGPEKRLLPVDQLIFACLQLPDSGAPDAHTRPRHSLQRCVYARLVRALREPDNHVLSCAPPLARTMILHRLNASSARPNTELAVAWWRAFNCPEFLPNLDVARAVRMLR
jgi:hypothetical protein